MTELSFLLELLLNHKLPKPTKEAITHRIKEVEARFVQTPQQSLLPVPGPQAIRPPRGAQSASTQRILDEMAAEGSNPIQGDGLGGYVDISQPAVIAQTPAALAALNARNEAIRIATSGKEEKGRTSPRKF